MSELQLTCTILIVSAQAGYIGYWVGRIRESNRWWPEVRELRETAARQALLLKLVPTDEVKP